MAGFTDYTENKMIDAFFRGQSFSFPATLYVALSTASASDASTGSSMNEVSGGSYARVAIVGGTGTWYSTNGATTAVSSGTGGATSNVAAINFPTSSADWGTIVSVVLCDASTNGNALFTSNLTQQKVMTSGDTFSFSASSLGVTID